MDNVFINVYGKTAAVFNPWQIKKESPHLEDFHFLESQHHLRLRYRFITEYHFNPIIHSPRLLLFSPLYPCFVVLEIVFFSFISPIIPSDFLQFDPKH